MITEPDVTELIQQATRNLDSLERLIRAAGSEVSPVDELRRRIARLRRAYTQETDELTRRVLESAIDRRSGTDRRRRRGELEPA